MAIGVEVEFDCFLPFELLLPRVATRTTSWRRGCKGDAPLGRRRSTQWWPASPCWLDKAPEWLCGG